MMMMPSPPKVTEVVSLPSELGLRLSSIASASGIHLGPRRLHVVGDDIARAINQVWVTDVQLGLIGDVEVQGASRERNAGQPTFAYD